VAPASTGLPNFANPFSILRPGSFPGQIVLKCRQQPHPRGDDRERITRARRAAEALFTPKPQLTEQSVPEFLSAADHRVRKPRILAISPATSSDREAVETPVSL
jgi:hypothetical protein